MINFKVEDGRELLGTRVLAVLVVSDEQVGREILEACFAECARIDQKYSRFKEGNELDLLNCSEGFCEVDAETFKLLKFAEQMKILSSGKFNICVKNVLEDWGYDRGYSFEEKESLSECGEVLFDEKGRVKLTGQVDFGAFGKGYAGDRMAEILRKEEKVKGFLLDVGGDLLTFGLDEKSEPFRIFFENPVNNEEAIGFVYAPKEGLAFASSSSSRRKWGKRHHLVDTEKMESADKMLAVFVQAESCMLADAWSTAFYVAGFELARDFLLAGDLGVEAMLVSPTGELWRSPNFVGELFMD